MNGWSGWYRYRMSDGERPRDIYYDYPDESGIYEIVDENGRIIYVGKSDVSLRNRLKSHIYSRKNRRLNGYCIWGAGAISVRFLLIPARITDHVEEILICDACQDRNQPVCNKRIPAWCRCR